LHTWAEPIVGNTGDLEQIPAVGKAVSCSLLYLDEGVFLHRVFLRKKALAYFKQLEMACRALCSRCRQKSSSAFLAALTGGLTGVNLNLGQPLI
jgi:hypothetical protein